MGGWRLLGYMQGCVGIVPCPVLSGVCGDAPPQENYKLWFSEIAIWELKSVIYSNIM